MNLRALLVLAAAALLCASAAAASEAKADASKSENGASAPEKRKQVARPNVLIFLVDDLGYGDLAVQGNSSLHTPNIDKLAHDGVRFTQWLSGSSICTPSRGALLTGRLPIRIGLASDIYQFRVFSPISPTGLPHSELTLAEALKARGYKTQMTGKWHLGIGDYLPPSHGFDSYYGMGITNVQSCNPQEHIHSQSTVAQYIFETQPGPVLWTSLPLGVLALWYLSVGPFRRAEVALGAAALIGLIFGAVVYFAAFYTLMNRKTCLLHRGMDIIQQPVNLSRLTQRMTIDAVRFVEENENSSQPWMLYMSYHKVHTALFNEPEFDGISSAGKYGDNVAEMDWSVGRILEALERSGQAEDTIVWFTSDNGPFKERGNKGGGSGELRGQTLKGGKGQTWEGGIRVPGIMRYDRRVRKGVVSEEPISTMDIFPTTLAFVDSVSRYTMKSKRALPQSFGVLDGKDVSKWLTTLGGSEIVPNRANAVMPHYCGETLAALRLDGKYKALWSTPVWDQALDSCPSTSMCGCSGKSVTYHDPPLLFDVRADPGEANPLTRENFQEYDDVMRRMESERAKHFESIEAEEPKQENEITKMWDPRYFPCCNPPHCECDDDDIR